MVSRSRRQFLKTVSLAGAALSTAGAVLSARRAAAFPGPAAAFPRGAESKEAQDHAYKYRIAFGCWINDMRGEALPLQKWPAPHLDDETEKSMIQAMDVQAGAGFNFLDAWGLFATYGYPADIASAFADKDRTDRVKRIIRAAADRGIKYLFGLGLMSWGYDQIIKSDPSVQGRNKAGQGLEHVMCGASEKAWSHVEKILDCALSQFDFCGVHIESADLGWCDCPECGGKDGVVGYNARLNERAAGHIRKKWPGRIVTCIPINWLGGTGRRHFDEAEMARIVDLSGHIDGFMDQGWTGTYIPDEKRKEFVAKLHCAYGTSGGLWIYHCGRWDRSSYFLPYARRTCEAIRRHFQDGARACMFYQGPVVNPGVEMNIAAGGRVLSDVRRNVEDVLGESIRRYYKPRNPAAQESLVRFFLQAEEAYFGRWDPKEFAARGIPMPGELHLTHLFGSVPGPPFYLLEPCLSADGRREYKKELVSLLKAAEGLEGGFEDGGRLQRIRKGLAFTLQLLDTVRASKGEPWSAE